MKMMRLSEMNKMMEKRHEARESRNMGIGALEHMNGQAKVGKVMSEFKKGKLHIGKSKKLVKKRSQAVAIGLSEAGLSKKGGKHGKG